MKSKTNMVYDHKKIESKWQKRWEKEGIYKAKDKSKKPNYYCLVEFPYPSGEGLHVGHIRSNTAMDIIARKRRMEGFNVLYPMGWDAFGLPAENYAIKTGIQPAVITKKNIGVFRRQLKESGFSFDWDREVDTTDPNYYKWTQWIFLQLLKAGLAYKKKMPINWCLSCKIGLANEEVIDNHCERCGGETDKREKEQWMLAITKYADRLDKDLDTVDYLPNIKLQQRNWIGRSEGATIKFKIKKEKRKNDKEEEIEVFTTRPDTIFGVTYLVLAADHPSLQGLSDAISNWKDVEMYTKDAKKKTDMERTAVGKEKTGVELKGIKAINPANKKEIPIYVADYVLSHYGTGAIMAVPAHDERDFEFAMKFNLPMVPVIVPEVNTYLIIEKSLVEGMGEELKKYGDVKVQKIDKNWGKFYRVTVQMKNEAHLISFLEKNLLKTSDDGGAWYADSMGSSNWAIFPGKRFNVVDGPSLEEYKKHGRTVGIPEEQLDIKLEAYIGSGLLINSGKFNGMKSQMAMKEILDMVHGETKTTFKLRDWVFSRQRYWGEPIPVVICETCGVVPVKDKDLPVKLPNVKNYKPTDNGESPLASVTAWVNVKCPKCGDGAKRETDTMPNWAGSSWYYLSYCFGNKKLKSKIKKEGLNEFRSGMNKWLPVDWYNGGMEHVTLHLLYSRFWHKFLFDQGFVPTAEPYKKRTAHGFVLGPNGEKMSKSRGNVINPDSVIKTLGADTLRVYEMFMGPFAEAIAWNTDSVVGSRRFIERVWRAFGKVNLVDSAGKISVSVNNTIKKVSEDFEEMKFNTAVSALMILLNEFEKMESISRVDYETFLLLLSPIAPHVTEELWVMIGNNSSTVLRAGKSIHLSTWPKYKLDHSEYGRIKIVIQVNSKVRDTMGVDRGLSDEELKDLVISRQNVKKWLNGMPIKKYFVVKEKLINIVI